MEQLGIEPSLLLAQIVNFSIIIFVLAKLLYKPILSMLAKRKKEIEEGLALTEKMREQEEKLKEKQDKLMEIARKDARALIEKAKKEAAEDTKQIIADAHAEANDIIGKGKAETERQHQEMLKTIKKEAVELAVAMTKRLTSEILTSADQHKFIEKQIRSMESQKVIKQ